MPINLTPVSSNTPVGIYESISDVRAECGTANTGLFSDPDNAGDTNEILLHQQNALDFADSYINAELAKANFATPATVNLLMLKIIGQKLAAYQLYQVRGLQDKTQNAFQAKFDWAKEELDKLIFNNQGGFTSNVVRAPIQAMGCRTGLPGFGWSC